MDKKLLEIAEQILNSIIPLINYAEKEISKEEEKTR